MKFSKAALRKHNAKRGDQSIYSTVIFISLLFLAAFIVGFLIGIYLLEFETRHWTYLNYTIPELEQHFECDEVFATTRPIWTAEQWREVRDFYRRFAGNHIGVYQIAKDSVFDSSELAVPFQAGKEKGRGLKAGRDIKEGEIVIRSSNNTIVFDDPLTYRKFLLEAEEIFPTFACDVMIWNWLQDLDNDGEKFGIVVDLNDNNLLNNEDEETSANLYCGTPGEEGSCLKTLQFYAAKDIAQGTELVGAYSDFVSSEATWEEFDL